MKTTSILLISLGIGCSVLASDEAEALRSRNDQLLRDLMRSSAVTAPEEEPVPVAVATPEPVQAPEPAPEPPQAVEAPVVNTDVPQLEDLQRRLQEVGATSQTVAPAPEAVVARKKPVEEAAEAPKKKGFFSRVFGKSGEAGQDSAPAITPPTTGPLGAVGANLPSRPAVDARKIRESRNALEDMIAQSREDVTRKTTSGENEVIGGQEIDIDFDLDPDAWKKAGPGAWKYQGEWSGGTFEGQGKLMYADGWSYQGAFKNGTMDGMGTLLLPDGTKYEGLWKSGEMHGVGKLTYPDGWVFVGQWRDGKISGRGTLVHPGQ